MAYSPVKQADVDPTTASYHNLTSGTTPSPHLAGIPLTPLSLSFDDLAEETTGNEPNARTEHAESTVSKFLASLSSSSRQSYNLVEDDDYEVMEQITPTLEKHPKTTAATMADTHPLDAPRGDLPMRTASISRQLPLNHPMPDLQSIQGAYVRNVERLEETAERLSLKSSLEGELQRIKHEQRQKERTTSGSSHANSVRSGAQRYVSNTIVDMNLAARSGGNSSTAFVASPVESIGSPRNVHSTVARKPSKTSRFSIALPESQSEGQPLYSDMATNESREVSDLDPRPVRSPSDASQGERPTTSGSGDTYQQARTLFTDFDGVHFAANRQLRQSRRISLSRPPRARDSQAFREPQPGQEMIYYPAPVPVMLNLPMRLSKMNWSEQEKKRLQALSDIPSEMRKSAAWLANEDGVPAPKNRNSTLPPQLRASAFFDHRGTTQDVQLKNGSAVATLDSILDAAAHAPVSAFTDHPIAGNLGNDFYSAEQTSRKSMQLPIVKKAKRKSSLSNLLKPRRSSGDLSEAMVRESRIPSVMSLKRDEEGSEDDHIRDDAERSLAPDADEMSESEHEDREGEAEKSDGDSDSDESQFRPGFSAAPTTLLAELQMRKAQQRSRNRTAIDAFPNGMHSTLLELDTVTQLQQKSRKQKHVKLAWEDKDAVDKENFEDEDVPLGVLFPEKEQQSRVNLNKPMGLMEKRELEENEPLSQRRARLRGEPLPPPPSERSPALLQEADEPEKPMLELPNLEGNEDDEKEGETLAQRIQRIKNRKANGTSAEFAQTLSSELGLKVESGAEGLRTTSTSKTPEIEETLGQRRKRLQAEASKAEDARPTLKSKRSLADVLQANPIGYVDPNKAKTAQSMMHDPVRAREREERYLAAQAADRAQAEASRHRFGHGHQGGLIQSPFGGYQGYPQMSPAMGMNYMPGAQGMAHVQPNYAYPSINSFGVQPGYMNPAMSAPNLHMNYPYAQPMAQGYAYQPAMDLTGMGPPLDQKQRARIEGWRQGIA